ncbi:S1 family peptidase [Salisediminibacterium beveridgei]|nr:serine protease [Salisediminibacterium beveridgei]
MSDEKNRSENDSINDEDSDEEVNEEPQKEEELFFDGERYYTRDEWFNPPDPMESPPKRKMKRGMKLTIAMLVTAALLGNVFAMWPQIFNLPAIEFVQVNRELSQDESIQELQDGVVVVRAGNSKGTGFVYNLEEGLVLTNEHVIDQQDPYPVITFENGEAYQSEIIYTDEDLDIAVLQVEDMNDHVELQFKNEWSQAEEIVFIGNPLFFNFIANRGQLIGLLEQSNRENAPLMLDAPVYRGSSGSPVFNASGEVIAVVYATTTTLVSGEDQRVGLAIPAGDFIHDIPGINSDSFE